MISTSDPAPVRAWGRLALPSQCAVCHGWGRQRVCAACTTRFTAQVSRCVGCALRVHGGVALCGGCLRRPPAFDRTLAAVDYDHPWDALIARFKFNEGLDLADTLARTVVDAWRRSGHAVPDLLLPVPLSARRLRERGFNQSWELARRIAHGLQCKADARLVLRIRDTAHQADQPLDRRGINVRGAFAMEPLRPDALHGLRVVLIDDVLTTGATVNEIATVLKRAGAERVDVWVLARTPSPGD